LNKSSYCHKASSQPKLGSHTRYEDSIASEYAKAFLAASWENSPTETPEIPGNAWERDTNSHGTHVTSTILGYSLYGTSVGGVAPLAKVIPVKVLHNSGFGWSSAIAKGIMYIADLKEQIGAPIVISMSLGGSVGSLIEREAIDYAISQGVPVVAAAGNKGDYGMDYPGAWEEVISVGACGWTLEWAPVFNQYWWYNRNVADPTDPEEVYITDFSGREKPEQDLDVVAPGSWVVGPYLNQGASRAQGEYWFLGGTSMATPHVSGIVALMLQKDMGDGDQDLTPSDIETILETTALSISAGSASVYMPGVGYYTVTWGSDATGAGIIQADLAISNTP
jgi:subtilisin family serine protease